MPDETTPMPELMPFGKPRLPITAEERIAIRKAYANGASIDSLAEKYGLERKQVTHMLQVSGFPTSEHPRIRGRGLFVTEEKEIAILREYRKTGNISTTAKAMGVSRPTVQNLLDEHGIIRDGRQQLLALTPKIVEAIGKKVESGESSIPDLCLVLKCNGVVTAQEKSDERSGDITINLALLTSGEGRAAIQALAASVEERKRAVVLDATCDEDSGRTGAGQDANLQTVPEA